MDKIINFILLNFSVLVSFIGLFFVVKIWLVWKRVDMNILKARVFLDEKFLIKNWVYIFITGALIVFRRILQLLDLNDITTQNPAWSILFDITGFVIVVLLVLIAYHWYKLVYSAIGSKKNVEAQ